jgi:phage baseplate assembly protein W
MALKYYPEDDANNTLGILLPMNGRSDRASDGFFAMSRTTEEQAISNYINLLLTKRGERYMQPEFGIGIQFYLFEQNVDALRLELESEIARQAGFWLPYIINHNIDVRPKADIPGLNGDAENALQIVITFSVTEAGANRTIALFEKGGRITYSLN